MVILPMMVGKTLQVHTGEEFAQVAVTEEMIGHRLGEFALTRKKTAHTMTGVTAKKEKRK
jgi:small subunit ribosomal protein S19